MHHADTPALLLRLFKVHAAHRGITYPQALDEALCFGWIDGVRRSLDADSFSQRFTPRTPRSIWSRVNIAHVERLKKSGRMAPAGLTAFNARDERRTAMYSFEQRRPELAPASVKTFRANAAAWAFYAAQPPGYRRITAHWVMSAKREETRAKRLGILMDCAAKGARIPQLTAGPKKGSRD
jgi:uncharacterized protein YdeI (YjbR/CyaY-like superfamily)